jgi:hypothetical protein
MVHPAPDGLIGNEDPTLGQKIFDIAEAQREPKIEPDRLLDDFGAGSDSRYSRVCSSPWLANRRRSRKPGPP